jgi:PIN domain nuclease of toxin-antitoxin system
VRLLLDTSAFLWFVQDDKRLSPRARRRIEDARVDKLLSVASIWEMSIKISIGKLRLGLPVLDIVEQGAIQQGMALLALAPAHAARVATLPRGHGDPFDRLLIAQALCEELVIATGDEAFDGYGVRRFW